MEWIMIGFSYLTRLIPLAILLALASFALWLLPTYNVAMFAQLAPWAQYVSIFCFAFLTGYLGYGAPFANWLAFSAAVLIFGLPTIPFASRFVAFIAIGGFGILMLISIFFDSMIAEPRFMGGICLFLSIIAGYFLLRPFPAYGAWVALLGLVLGHALIKAYIAHVNHYHGLGFEDTMLMLAVALPAMFFICCRGNIVSVLGGFGTLVSAWMIYMEMK